MAVNIRGDITYLIGGNNTGFSRAISDTRAQLDSFFNETSRLGQANILGGVFAKGAAGAISVTAALGSAVGAIADNYREMSILADQTGLTVQGFRALDFAARQYGSTGEQIADITKDIKDKAQEFARDATGPFEDLRNELGLTTDEAKVLARQMVEASGPKSISLMISKMEDLGLTANQQTQALESLGNDLSRIQGLFADGGAEMARYNEMARSVTLPDEELDTKPLKEASASFDLLGLSITSFIEGTGSPVVKWFSDAAQNAAHFWGEINEGTEAQVSNDIADLTDELIELREEVKNNETALGRFWNVLTFTSTDTQVLNDKIEELKKEREKLQKELIEKRTGGTPQATDIGEGDEEFVGPIKPKKGKKEPKVDADRKAAAKAEVDLILNSASAEEQTLNRRKAAFKKFLDAKEISLEDYNKVEKKLDADFETAQKDRESKEKAAADREAKRLEQRKASAQAEVGFLVNGTSAEEQAYQNRKASFQKYLDDKLISQQEFDSADKALREQRDQEEAESNLERMNQAHELRMQQLEAERAAIEEFGGFTGNLYLTISESMLSVSDVMQNTVTQAIDGVSGALSNALINGENLGDSLVQVAKSIAQSFVQALIKIGIQELVLATLRKTLGGTSAAGYVASVTGQATAGVQLAALNAFSSTAAIPIVGPAAAPAAAAAAAAAASPFSVAAITAASSVLAGAAAREKGGPVINGQTYLVGERGPELFTPNQSGGIVPNDQLGGGNNFNVEISAIDAVGVEQMLLENTDLLLGLVNEA